MLNSFPLDNPEVATGKASNQRYLERWLRSPVVAGLALAAPIVVQLLLVGQRLLDWWPVWAWYPDPGYQYLFAGGSVVTGGTTDLIYHPGSSFQWLIGISLIVTFLVRGQGSFMLDVASRPEFYAQSVGILLASLYVAALVFAAWRMHRWLGLWPALAFQLLMLWGLPLLAAGRFVLWPESLGLTSAVVVLALVSPQLSDQSPNDSHWQAVVLGLVGAVGITAKVTFAPLLLLTVVLLPWKRLVWFLAPLVVFSLAMMTPVFSRLDSMQAWFVGITTNPGRHGQAGAWDPIGNLIDSMLMLNAVVRWFLPVLALALALAVVALFRAPQTKWRKVMALVLPLGIVLASGLKDSEVRDFILAIPLVSALIAESLMQLRGVLAPIARRLLTAMVLIVSTFLAAHGIVQEEYFTRALEPRINEIQRDAAAIDELNSAGLWASGYNAWTPESSSVFGLIWSAGSFNREIRETTPEATHFDLFGRQILHVNQTGRLVEFSCLELQKQSTRSSLGVVVQSQGHIATDATTGRILLSNATADAVEPTQVGRYFAYPLTGIQCIE